ncbi:sugar phosphate nucleotidyltransferase [Flavitalea sp. BT771]|uniref:nucleotidyltransferase family protein n=1 Tax=Flavitalea sp. BT771 TaxID=3063329 RepID=UPI0026E37FEA|nr:sugar phosphate nucleotidyltransferase [Flavitalea sp. BT771]MDO6432472.1 sugar phosphate nucleotidyltransferase [Flavitalea sp. BT771]MDV6221381.1 sugar phosphate nucleotidyltransferase [Flavitalea sp. BT771]
MKQIQGFGPNGETIMDYSIYDAVRAGFKKVVFIIRKDFAEDFKNIFEPKWKDKVALDYVFQDLHAYTGSFQVPAERTKPWGTAHAVLCAQEVVHEPFAVINADDFYGRDAFEKAYAFLTKDVNDKLYSIIGYELAKTLSDNGTVSRGVCQVDGGGNLVSIAERTKIYQDGDKITYEEGDKKFEVPFDSKVSMNFWCFAPSVFPYITKLFAEFLKEQGTNPKAEFFIPIIGDKFIQDGKGAIKVIPTDAQWFGVTYKEDAPDVQASLNKLIAKGEYPNKIY